MLKYGFIIAGGGIGALLRYIVSGLIYKLSGSMFPWGTICVNLIGSFTIGFLWALFERLTFSPNLRVFIFIGILGGFTTFSTYSLETYNLLRDGELKFALSNILISNIIGILLVFLGVATTRYLFTLFK